MKKLNAGDVVPYKNTRGNIAHAKITSFKVVNGSNPFFWLESNTEPTVENVKTIWFEGIDIKTKAKVWYPLHKSKENLERYEEDL